MPCFFGLEFYNKCILYNFTFVSVLTPYSTLFSFATYTIVLDKFRGNVLWLQKRNGNAYVLLNGMKRHTSVSRLMASIIYFGALNISRVIRVIGVTRTFCYSNAN